MKNIKTYTIVDGAKDLADILISFISKDYNLQFTNDKNADYVFHSVTGRDVLKYSGIRIFITGENISPDFNISDYAIAFDYINYKDRYKRIPLYRFYLNAYKNLLCKRPDPKVIMNSKENFCSYVMSNVKNSAPERSKIFDVISSYKTIHSGGKWNNNIGGRVNDKISFISKSKFTLAIENSSSPGYCTEKFAEAALANCIPIYWGDPTIEEQFNPKSYINANKYSSINELKEVIINIDQNDEKYKEMLSEPWFINNEPANLTSESIKNFLNNIFSQPINTAYRRNFSRWGLKYIKKRIK